MARPARLGLAETSTSAPQARLGRGLALSLAAHAGLAVWLFLWLAVPPEHTALATPEPAAHLVFLEAPGPTGGSGGAPLARPAPKPPAPQPAAVAAPPLPPVPTTPPSVISPPPPTPSLASVVTISAEVSAFQGAPVTIGGPGGPGGRGVGNKPGSGAGDDAGPGADDGPGGPGSGLSGPFVLRKVSPDYSGRAMVAKIEGTVSLEVEVEPDGSVGMARVTKSLDPGGLDDEAVKAARQWRFAPATRNGKPVATLVTLLLDFHLR